MTFSFPVGRRRARGFTLIELMIVVAIIGILVAIAFPAYNQSVRKSRRSDAKAALLDLAAREERYLSTANVYTDTASLLGYGTTGVTVTSTNPMNIYTGSAVYYTLSVSPTAPTSTTPAAFTATATPQGAQASDTCGTYTLTNTGFQNVSAGTVADCW